jgi:WhiB family redox-sensing transcriptional regulator
MTMTMTREMDWQREAACGGVSRDIFFPDEYELPDPAALRLCERCPVQPACLDWALTHDERGIWGGLTYDERTKILKTMHRVKCPDCGSRNVEELERCEVCVNCGLSWPI